MDGSCTRMERRIRGRGEDWAPASPLWEKVSPEATDEGCSRERQRLTPLEHPSSDPALTCRATALGESRASPALRAPQGEKARTALAFV